MFFFCQHFYRPGEIVIPQTFFLIHRLHLHPVVKETYIGEAMSEIHGNLCVGFQIHVLSCHPALPYEEVQCGRAAVVTGLHPSPENRGFVAIGIAVGIDGRNLQIWYALCTGVGQCMDGNAQTVDDAELFVPQPAIACQHDRRHLIQSLFRAQILKGLGQQAVIFRSLQAISECVILHIIARITILLPHWFGDSFQECPFCPAPKLQIHGCGVIGQKKHFRSDPAMALKVQNGADNEQDEDV
ncbi:hypothetical protein DSECCO2_488250 [anaerobic digester metagenome]